MKILHMTMLIVIALCILGCEADQKLPKRTSDNRHLTEYCVKGYVFLTYFELYSGGLTQVWENTVDGPRPKMCTQEGAE